MTIRNDAIDLLIALGNDADTVARKLQELGIKGVRGKICLCPIARYLSRELKDHVYACVSSITIGDFIHGMDLKPPQAVIDFINSFDAGLFRDLEDPT